MDSERNLKSCHEKVGLEYFLVLIPKLPCKANHFSSPSLTFGLETWPALHLQSGDTSSWIKRLSGRARGAMATPCNATTGAQIT